MQIIKRKQSKREKAQALLADYVQLKAIKDLVKRIPSAKAAPVIGAVTAAGAAGAAGNVAKRRRSGGTPSPA